METPPPIHSGYSDSHFAPYCPVAGASQLKETQVQKRISSLPLRLILRCMETVPILFWGVVWLIIFGVSTVSIQSLLNLNASDQTLIRFNQPASQSTDLQNSAATIAPSSVPTVQTSPSPYVATAPIQEPVKQPVNPEGQVSPWLFGAIGLGCMAGSILLSRRLRPEFDDDELTGLGRKGRRQKTGGRRESRGQRSPKRLALYSAEEKLPFGSPKATSLRSSRNSAKIPTFQVAASVQQIPRLHISPSPITARSLYEEPTPIPDALPVIVLPPDQSHPLDWGEARLADAVDLRRLRSLDSFMEKS
jgi:hypothetical protein